jgi:hypothetical protein
MRFEEIQAVKPAIDSATDLYQQKADALKDKAKKADVIAKQRKQYELVDKARDDLSKQQEKLTQVNKT